METKETTVTAVPTARYGISASRARRHDGWHQAIRQAIRVSREASPWGRFSNLPVKKCRTHSRHRHGHSAGRLGATLVIAWVLLRLLRPARSNSQQFSVVGFRRNPAPLPKTYEAIHKPNDADVPRHRRRPGDRDHRWGRLGQAPSAAVTAGIGLQCELSKNDPTNRRFQPTCASRFIKDRTH